MRVDVHGREWELRAADEAVVRELAEATGCPPAIARVLASRGIGQEELEGFFRPRMSDLHAPGLLLGMREAVERIRRAVHEREPILIYGDYDVDGTTATVLLKTAIDRLAGVGAGSGEASLVSWHVPHRIREGYGMRSSRLGEAAAAGVRLVISVDTGIRAFAAAEEARALGMDLIVTDHHLPDEVSGVPEAVAVINPAQAGCGYPCKSLCGAAVAFKLAHALLLAQAGEQPDADAAMRFLEGRLLPSLLKLVAIATIADSVPLRGENRTLASLGLRELANPVQPGLRALMEVASLPLDEAPSASDIGFRIGPRINAAGRMDVADDVIELFLTRSPERARELATKLNELNEERRRTEREAMEAIEARLAELLDGAAYPAECLVLDDPAWHRGVLGILASRVVERTGRPALVLTHEGEEMHGSGRSVAGFHLLDALTEASEAADEAVPARALFTRFGGHAHAVGLSLPRARLATLRARLQALSGERLTAEVLAPALVVDAVLALGDLTFEMASWLERCEPFGNGHAEPVFLMEGARLLAPARWIKEQHLCLSLVPAPHGPPLQATAWTRAGRSWPERAGGLDLSAGASVDVAFRLRAKSNSWFSGLELDLVELWQSSGPKDEERSGGPMQDAG